MMDRMLVAPLARICVAPHGTAREIYFGTDYEVSEPWRDLGALKSGMEKLPAGIIKLNCVVLGDASYGLDLRWLEWAFSVNRIEYGESRIDTLFATARIIGAHYGRHGDPIPWSLTLQTSGLG